MEGVRLIPGSRKPKTEGSDTDDRRTPQWLYDVLDHEFHFVWDLAATEANKKTADPLAYFGPDHPFPHWRNALEIPSWYDEIRESRGDVEGDPIAVWLNMPYGRNNGTSIYDWLRKCQLESDRSPITIVSLPSADVSTAYWHDFIHGKEHRTLRTRLKFDGAPTGEDGKLNTAKFGSVIRIFRPSHKYWSFA